MEGKFPKLTNKQMVLGIVALAMVLVLLILMALGMTMCTGPEATAPSTTVPTTTQSTAPTLPANPYGAGDFGYRDGYLHCLSGKSMLGIDVSSHQGIIDWETVADQGIKFVMVRLGYRGWGNGEMVADEYALENLQGAKAAGLKVGAYFYSQAVNTKEALEEAQLVLSILDGMELSMPVVFDWEVFSAEGRNANVKKETATDCAMVFCGEIQRAGYEPMVYFNLDLGQRLLDLPKLEQAGYKLWLALYMEMTYPYKVDMWQYSASGQVKGISGPVDLNLYFTYD